MRRRTPTVAGDRRRGPRSGRSPFRPLCAHRGLQRGDQPAPVPGAGPAVARRLPPARHHLSGTARPRRRRPASRAAPRARRDRRPHLGVGARARKVLCTGDLFIWACPNAGNPQKVQRYARDWAPALREMAALRRRGADAGPRPADRRRRQRGQVLNDTAELLESLHDQTLAMMNAGARLDEILHTVRAPDAPADQALPAADLRRARVRRPQRLAALRRLVRRRTLRTSSRRPTPRWPRSWRRSPAARRLAGAGAGAGRAPATCRWPATSSSWRRRPRPTTRPCTGPGRGVRAPGRRRALADGKGVYRWAAAESEERATLR